MLAKSNSSASSMSALRTHCHDPRPKKRKDLRRGRGPGPASSDDPEKCVGRMLPASACRSRLDHQHLSAPQWAYAARGVSRSASSRASPETAGQVDDSRCGTGGLDRGWDGGEESE